MKTLSAFCGYTWPGDCSNMLSPKGEWHQCHAQFGHFTKHQCGCREERQCHRMLTVTRDARKHLWAPESAF